MLQVIGMRSKLRMNVEQDVHVSLREEWPKDSRK